MGLEENVPDRCSLVAVLIVQGAESKGSHSIDTVIFLKVIVHYRPLQMVHVYTIYFKQVDN